MGSLQTDPWLWSLFSLVFVCKGNNLWNHVPKFPSHCSRGDSVCMNWPRTLVCSLLLRLHWQVTVWSKADLQSGKLIWFTKMFLWHHLFAFKVIRLKSEWSHDSLVLKSKSRCKSFMSQVWSRHICDFTLPFRPSHVTQVHTSTRFVFKHVTLVFGLLDDGHQDWKRRFISF